MYLSTLDGLTECDSLFPLFRQSVSLRIFPFSALSHLHYDPNESRTTLCQPERPSHPAYYR
jgi:hypothetical protein